MKPMSQNNVPFIKGTVILRKTATVYGCLIPSFLRRKISIQLISAVNTSSDNLKGKLGKRVYLKKEITESKGLADGESAFRLKFNWDDEVDIPGAILVRNEHHHHEFYLRTVTLEGIPGHEKLHFVCNSWVYPARYYQKDRVFFTNKAYLPQQTPEPLRKYREEELEVLRGKGKENDMLEDWDRVYDYAYYNDLGEPDKSPEYVRPIFGGSAEYPYPRRGRTSRPPTKTDPKTESRLNVLKGKVIYVPRDEKFGHIKLSDFLADTVKSLSQGVTGLLNSVFDKTPKEFDSFQDVLSMYEGGFKLPDNILLGKVRENIPTQFLKALARSDDAQILKYPMPAIIKEDKSAWRTDEEFAREMLAGINPLVIRRLKEFPPASKLDAEIYGNQNSSITKECVEKHLDGLTVEEAIARNRLYILDHHDTIMPFLRQINTDTPSKVYATRTLLLLKDDGTLKPLVIELSLPHSKGDQLGALSKVYTPANEGVEASLWWLAKTYVTVNDSAHHQLISHWLNTHAVIEPFIIATNRQLSKLHPIHKLLHPHFRDTMPVNTIARQIALNADGLFEAAVFPRKYVGHWTSAIYKDWVFTEQALPRDLIKRGMAVKDSKSPHGYKLLIEDYPYAVDGLEIWSAIETWVKDYCSFYYRSDDMVANDPELQTWWKEIREKGHGDKKDEKWWPEMKTLDELTESCTTIIWVASVLHAVVNFGQYPYGGYMPNRPTISRKFMPEPNTPEFEELKKNPDAVFFKTVISQARTMVAISVIELISRHSEDEVYLGEREQGWTCDNLPLEAFERFSKSLVEIEERILERNNDPKLKNRVGPAKLPFTLLCPSSGVGITGRGIPNSVSLQKMLRMREKARSYCSAVKNSDKSVFVQENEESSNNSKMIIEGRVILKKKTLSGLKDQLKSSILRSDDVLVGKKVSFQLVSAVHSDPANSKGILGKASYLEEQIKEFNGLADGEYAFKVFFDLDEEVALPGAITVRNEHYREFYLRTITLQNIPNHGDIHFLCNSWIYPTYCYQNDRVFFTNKTYLPDQTPIPLRKYREEELELLRGEGKENEMLKEWDRVYDYAYYNDLGEPSKGQEYVRPILGGSAEYPYPRRGRTNPDSESRLSLLKGIHAYIPRDEKFGHLKLSEFFGDTVKSLAQGVFGMLDAVFDLTPKQFDSFEEVMGMYKGTITLPDSPSLNKLRKNVPTKFLKALFRSDGAALMNYPMPDIVKVDESAWRTDEEFARQMLAGIHPLIIRRLEEFPPVSKLDPKVYGNQNSSMTRECIEGNLNGLSVKEAMKSNRLFILDHHDTTMPLLRKINTDTPSRVYATRTLLFLKDDRTLKPLVIELSLPHPDGDQFGAISKLYRQANEGVEASLWWLAKTYVTVNDSAYHQLISHWLHSHAIIEPFIIATNRQLSKLHPIYKLLHPHFRDTMSVNTIARQIALNAKGLFEQAVFPRQYVGEWTSALYKDWVFTEHALPRDLMKRGMAVKDQNRPHGYKLLIEDYPYAVDGLEIWSAIETWVKEYCSFYYKSNDMIANDPELQSWWKEIREVGHGDKKDDKWWPKMKTFSELTETCTTIIWLASAFHAVLNFGQYPYSGYMPNRPTISRQFMPEPNTPEFEELKKNPDTVFLKTVTSQLRTMVCISVIELISRHSEDEVYLGEREEGWTSDSLPLNAFERFSKSLVEIENKILERNNDPRLKNRVGPAKLPFILLCPSSGVGITGRGIPNSVSL
ncbi:putative linoleate 9S-lipoxygenase 5 [Bienertia sinuspersici]